MDKNVGTKNAPTWQYDIVRGLMCFFIFNCHFLAMFNFPKQSSMVLQYLKASLSNAHLGVIFNESVNRLIDMILSSLLLLVMYHKTLAGINVLAKFPFVNTLGKISYEFFVYHLCVIASFSCWIFLQLYSECGYYIALLITYFCTVIVVFALSWVSYYLTSKYYNPILKRLV